jgi:hypothetical protein
MKGLSAHSDIKIKFYLKIGTSSKFRLTVTGIFREINL